MMSIGLVSQKLKLRPVVTCTAVIYWHRYHAAGVVAEENNDIGLACLFLACKVEECGIHIEHFLEEAHKVVKSPLVLQERREVLIANETHVLKQIGFNLVVEHAQPVAKELISSSSLEEKIQNELTNHAFAILQDFLVKDAQYIQYDVDMLARAAVSLAVKYMQFTSKSKLEDLDSLVSNNNNNPQVLQLEHRIMDCLSPPAAQ